MMKKNILTTKTLVNHGVQSQITRNLMFYINYFIVISSSQLRVIVMLRFHHNMGLLTSENCCNMSQCFYIYIYV